MNVNSVIEEITKSKFKNIYQKMLPKHLERQGVFILFDIVSMSRSMNAPLKFSLTGLWGIFLEFLL